MQTKISQLRAHMAAGEWDLALRMAARFGRLGKHREAITRAWAALTNPAMYREMGQDPEALVALGRRALVERYS